MQDDCNRLSRIRLQHYGWSVNSYALLSPVAVRQKLLRDQSAKLGSRPTRFHEQRMDLCERINASFDQFLKTVRRIGMRKMHRRLHGGQDVLCSMLGLAREIDDLSLAPFALCYILKAVDGADNVSPAVLDCLDVNERDAARTIRSLNVDLLLAHGNAGAQHIGHGALMMWERTAVGVEHSIRSAKPFIGIAE
jgi:hypothetical protein